MAFVYSCCFWFSLRLGGIIIGFFSLLQGILALAACCVAHNRQAELKDQITYLLMDNLKLIYMKDYLQIVRENPAKYVILGICFTCFYIFFCLLYIYGAYACNNILMYGFIFAELIRLVALALLVATWLLVLKQNTMDIGLLIGASVGCGFLLLGMFYLWICAANLPVLINEMQRDEQAETIAWLRRLLQENPKPGPGRGATKFPPEPADDPYGDVFMVHRRWPDIGREWLTEPKPYNFYR